MAQLMGITVMNSWLSRRHPSHPPGEPWGGRLATASSFLQGTLGPQHLPRAVIKYIQHLEKGGGWGTSADTFLKCNGNKREKLTSLLQITSSREVISLP